MRTIRTGIHPAGRLEMGAAVLAAAEGVDVTPVRARLDEFATAQAAYGDAQQTLQGIEAQLRVQRRAVEAHRRAQDDTVEALARALVAEGQPRGNPFAAYGFDAPSLIKDLQHGEQARVIRQLINALQHEPSLTEATHRAIQDADVIVQRMGALLVELEKLQTGLRTARDVRDAAERAWDKAIGRLKRLARVAEDNGATGLYKALFGRVVARKKAAESTPEAAPPAPVAGGNS